MLSALLSVENMDSRELKYGRKITGKLILFWQMR
jgi:hypothetical protein